MKTMHMLKTYGKYLEKKLGEYHDLYVQSDTLLLAENFRDKCIDNYRLHLAQFLSAPGLV